MINAVVPPPPNTLAPNLGRIEKWSIGFLHLLMCFVPFVTLRVRCVSRSWRYFCDNDCGMVIRYTKHLRPGLVKYIDLLITGRVNRIQPSSLRVLRLHISTYKSTTEAKLLAFVNGLHPIKHFPQMTSLYLAFDLDFYVYNSLAIAVANVLPIRLVTLELHFHCKCIIQSHGAFAITNAICEMKNIRNLLLWFTGYREGIYYPGEQIMKECFKRLSKQLKHVLNQRIYCNSKLIHTKDWEYAKSVNALAGRAFKAVNLFPTV